jgi:hypothetical protein
MFVYLTIIFAPVAFIGWAFYAYRIYALSKLWKMPVFIGMVGISFCPRLIVGPGRP